MKHYQLLGQLCLALTLLTSTGCSSYVLNLTEAETVEEGKVEISGAGVPGIYFSEKELIPSIGVFAAYGLTPTMDIRVGASMYTEVVDSRLEGHDGRLVNTSSGYGLGVGTKIQIESYELLEVLGLNNMMDWSIDLPIAYYSEDSIIGEGIVFAPALIGTMDVDEYSSYSVVMRFNSAHPFDNETSRFGRTSWSIGSTRYLDENLILRFNLSGDLFRLLDGYVSPGIGLAYRL